MIELFIEDQQADIDVGFSTLMTYAVDDVKDFGSKNTSFSKTIILPGTKVNNTLFGNIFAINRSTQHVSALPNIGTNFNAAASAKAVVYSNNIQIFKGVLRLLEIVIDNGFIEYEVAVFGDLGGFVAKLGNKRLEDLDFSSLDHTYTITNITNSWNNANVPNTYYYPLIDYGGVSTGAFGIAKKDYQFRTFRPALHVQDYINKIIANAGYTYESVFFNTDFFKRLIIPNNQKSLFIPKNQVFNTTANPTYSVSGTVTSGTDPTIINDQVTFPAFIGGLFTTANNKVFTYTGTSASFSVRLILTGQLTLSGVIVGGLEVRISIFKNGALAYSNGVVYGKSTQGTSGYLYYDTAQISLLTNDTIQIQVQTIANKRPSGFNYTFAHSINGVSMTIDSPVPVLSPAELGDNIKFNEIQPKNIFQKDFFASILKMFNLIVTENKDKPKHLVIEPYVDYYKTDTATFEDWSDKIDRSQPIKIKPMSELNARYYELNFKSDSDFYNDEYRKKYSEGYGDRVYDNGFEFAKERESVEVIFAQSVLTGYQGEEKVVPAIFKRNNNVEDKIEHVIRIMQAKKIIDVAPWNILDNATILTPQVVYPYAGHLDDPDAPVTDLNFGTPKELKFVLVSGNLSANLFNIFYSSYFAEVTDVDSKLLTAKIRLTRKDIYDLDFSKFVYVDGGLFRKNNIIDYNATDEDTCTVELLKVQNINY